MPIGKIYSAPSIQFTPVLNAGLKWEELDRRDQDGFRGLGEKIKLPIGYRLYKFTEARYDMKPTGRVTPWWSPFDRFRFDTGLQARLQAARHEAVDPAAKTRAVAAVRKNWNQLTHILTARLLKEVYCFWGECGWQPFEGGADIETYRRFDAVMKELARGAPHQTIDHKVHGFMGGASQFLIPGLIRNTHIARGVFVPVANVIAGLQIF
jgi:hypothetical protein